MQDDGRARIERLGRALAARGALRDWWRLDGGGDERLAAILGWASGAPPARVGDPVALDAAVAAAFEALEMTPPWTQLGARCLIGRLELQVLAGLLSLQVEPEARALARRSDPRGPTLELAVRWLADGRLPASGLRGWLAPSGALLRVGLLGETPSGPEEGDGGRRLFVPPEVERGLLGPPAEPPRPLTDWVDWPGLAAARAVIDGRLQGLAETPLLLFGASGSGRATLVRQRCATLGVPLQELRFSATLTPSQLDTRLRARQALARLQGAALLLRGPQPVPPPLLEILGQRLDPGPAQIVLLDLEDAASALAACPQATPLTWQPPDAGGRAGLVERFARGAGWGVPPGLALALADSYQLTPRELGRAFVDLGPGAQAPLDWRALDACIRQRVRSRLADLADLIEVHQRWDALVLEESQRRVVDEIIGSARHRSTVLREWGFSAQYGDRQGLACLFSGPPGTGKTLTAGLIADTLGLAAYRVDLARVVDKYVGETEKNLARLFDEADRVPVVLVFDEADALFSSRTQVQSGQDRYANLEVNYLLQRMERFGGITVLTTNRASALDPAFRRRLRFHVHFELPEVADRERLWRRMVPPGCLLGEVDFGQLARRFTVSGAVIRKVVLRGAFLAAQRAQPLDGALLEAAMRAELAEAGRLASEP